MELGAPVVDHREMSMTVELPVGTAATEVTLGDAMTAQGSW
jgi:hypothetical protein